MMQRTMLIVGLCVLAVSFGCATTGDGPDVISIFNGKDFEGWELPKNNTWWSVEDGMIRTQSGPRKKGSNIWTEQKFKNFIVELDFRFGKGTIDSGVFLRTENQQVQLGMSGSMKRDMTGSIFVKGDGYPMEAEGVKDVLELKDWNHMKIKAEGNVYTMTLNGKEVLVYEDKTKKAVEEGPIGLQLHPGKVMAIDFKNIKVAEL